MENVFVTGIDTDIGKTFVSIGLCLKKENENVKTGYFKPLQSGAYQKDNMLIAPDLYELKKYSNIPSMYSYLFKGEVSPYLASTIDNTKVELSKIKNDYNDFSKNLEYIVAEGAGGLYCPAGDNLLFSDIIKELNQEIVIVTTPCLGKLNHTLMTIECAKLNNIKIKGIIINKIPKNPTLSEKNFIKELSAFSDIEILGKIPQVNNPDKNEIINIFKDVNL